MSLSKSTERKIKFWLVVFTSAVVGFVFQRWVADSFGQTVYFSDNYLWMTIFTPLAASLLWFLNSSVNKNKPTVVSVLLGIGSILFFLLITIYIQKGSFYTGPGRIGGTRGLPYLLFLLPIAIPIGAILGFLIKHISED